MHLNIYQDSHCCIWRSRIVDFMLVDIINDRVLQQIPDALTALQSSPDSRRTDFIWDPFSYNANIVLKIKKVIKKINFAIDGKRFMKVTEIAYKD